jgi:hypothetical protein
MVVDDRHIDTAVNISRSRKLQSLDKSPNIVPVT